MEEAEIACPFCGESISISLDPSIEEQDYIEDCSVCCRPIQISLRFEDGNLVQLEADRGS